MKKVVQLNFTERAARSLNTEAKLRVTTTELYDQYTHPEDMQLFIQIVGDDKRYIPNIYIDEVTLKNLRYTLLQLTRNALNNCIVWLRAYDDGPLQEFATVCHTQYADFKIYDCSFTLCDFSTQGNGISVPSNDTLVLLEAEVTDALDNVKNII